MRHHTLIPVLLLIGLSLPAIAEDPTEETQPRDAEPQNLDFPAELTLPMDRIPEPAHRSILQRIDDHERLDQMLTAPPPRDIPIEVRPSESGDQIRIRLR